MTHTAAKNCEATTKSAPMMALKSSVPTRSKGSRSRGARPPIVTSTAGTSRPRPTSASTGSASRDVPRSTTTAWTTTSSPRRSAARSTEVRDEGLWAPADSAAARDTARPSTSSSARAARLLLGRDGPPRHQERVGRDHPLAVGGAVAHADPLIPGHDRPLRQVGRPHGPSRGCRRCLRRGAGGVDAQGRPRPVARHAQPPRQPSGDVEGVAADLRELLDTADAPKEGAKATDIEMELIRARFYGVPI